METRDNFLPAVVESVPGRTELEKVVESFIANKAYSPVEKYVILKGSEYVIKTALGKTKKAAIDDFLTAYEGASTFYVMGTTVQVTNERKDVTRKRYIYSEEVTKIEDEIAKQKEFLEYLNDKLKLQQAYEINQNIAKEDMFAASEPPAYGITVTLAK